MDAFGGVTLNRHWFIAQVPLAQAAGRGSGLVRGDCAVGVGAVIGGKA
jgi:hypothetical protein